MLYGSIAMNLYSIPRMARDIDIVIELGSDRKEEYVQLFPDSYIDKDMILDKINRNGMFNVIDNVTGFMIDYILRKNTEYYETALPVYNNTLPEFNRELFWDSDYESENFSRHSRHIIERVLMRGNLDVFLN